jgi:hypothetical protein
MDTKPKLEPLSTALELEQAKHELRVAHTQIRRLKEENKNLLRSSRSLEQRMDAEVIVLSDDDDNGPMCTSKSIKKEVVEISDGEDLPAPLAPAVSAVKTLHSKFPLSFTVTTRI